MADQAADTPGQLDAGEIRAAGAVLWRQAPAELEVALVHRPRYDDWAYAKGKELPGEHVVLTAVREVAEETGVQVVLGRRLPTSRYLSGGRPKRVDYWAARAADDPQTDGFVPNEEVDDLAWLPLAAARDRLTYPHDADLLAQFGSGPAATAPVILARHVSARSKSSWRAAGHTDDLGRPLTQRGQAQARELAEILGCFGPARVVSSAAERCQASMRPYAELAGATVEPEPAFTINSRAGSGAQEAARQRITELVAAREPVLICAHRENLPSLLAWVCEELGAGVPAGWPLRKGGFWVLQAAGRVLASAEQHSLTG
jgi:8-oxo-dGTP diphosphatase